MSITADQFLEYCYVFKVPVNGNGGGGGGGSSATAYVASTVNLAGTYNNGAAGVGATLTLTAVGTFQLDGVTPAVSSIVLIKDQTDATQNGLYTVTVNTAGSQGLLTRAVTYDTPAEINSIGLIIIQSGSTLAGDSFYLTAPVTTIGTSLIDYALYSLGVTSISSNGTINVSSPIGDVQVTLPQSVATTATPTFASVLLSAITAHGALVAASDNTVSSVAPGASGNVMTSNGTDWTSSAPATAPDDTVMSNISGSAAVPIANTVTALLDATISATPNAIPYRNSTTWTGLPSAPNAILTTDNAGVLEYSTELPASVIPIDYYSLNVQSGKPFLDYNLSSTGVFPAQMVAFSNYVTVINNISNTIQTFEILSSGVVNSVDTVATGGNPTAIVNFSISGSYYVAVTNAADNTFQVYLWTESTTSFASIGAAITTVALSPRGIAFNVIGGTPSLTVAGYISDIIQLFQWNGTTFVSASSGVLTGSAPGSATGFDFSGTSYFSVVNTAGSSASVYSYVGSDWVLFQTIPTNSTPLSLKMFSFNSVLYLAVACSIGDSIEVFKLSTGTFVAAGSTTSSGVPVSIDQFELNNVCYISVIGTFASSLRTYIYNTTLNTLVQDGAETLTRGATPADMVAYQLLNSDGSYTQFISVTNSLSDNMTTFYYADGLICVAPIASGSIIANLNPDTNAPIGNTVSDVLDYVFTDVQGSFLYRSSAGWTDLAPGASGTFIQSQGIGADLIWADGGGLTSIDNNQMLANISGIPAEPVGVTATNYFDSAFGNTVNSTVVRTPSGWVDVESIPASLVPIDTDSLATTGTDLFYSFGVTSTGNSPKQVVAFGNLVSVINSASNNVTTYSFVSPNSITLINTVGTGPAPTALAYCPISTSEYLVVTNSGDNTFQLYTWNSGSQTWVVTGLAQFTFVSQPAGAVYCNLNDTSPAVVIVGGPASNSVQLFLWAGSSFTPTGAAVSTGGSTPGQASSYNLGGVSYIAVVNTASSNISIFTYNGTALVMSQLVSCNANPVASAFFESDGMLYLTVACNSAGTIDVFRLSGSTFSSVSSLGSIPSPTSIAYFSANGQHYISIVSSVWNAMLTYIYSTTTLNFYWGSNVATLGTSPADMVPFTITNPDTSITQLMAISNNSSNNLSAFYFQDDLITLAPIPNLTLLANVSGAAATPSATTVSALLDASITNTRGSVLYRGAAGWTYLIPSFPGYFLKTQGAALDPIWDDPLVPVNNNYVLANISGSVNNPRGYPLSDILDTVFGSTVGSILIRNASTWTILPPGTNNYYLKSFGAGVPPAWSPVSTTIVSSLVTVPDGVLLYPITVTGVTTASRVVASINEQGGSIYLTKVLTGPNEIRFYFSAATSGVVLSYMLDV